MDLKFRYRKHQSDNQFRITRLINIEVKTAAKSQSMSNFEIIELLKNFNDSSKGDKADSEMSIVMDEVTKVAEDELYSM